MIKMTPQLPIFFWGDGSDPLRGEIDMFSQMSAVSTDLGACTTVDPSLSWHHNQPKNATGGSATTVTLWSEALQCPCPQQLVNQRQGETLHSAHSALGEGVQEQTLRMCSWRIL